MNNIEEVRYYVGLDIYKNWNICYKHVKNELLYRYLDSLCDKIRDGNYLVLAGGLTLYKEEVENREAVITAKASALTVPVVESLELTLAIFEKLTKTTVTKLPFASSRAVCIHQGSVTEAREGFLRREDILLDELITTADGNAYCMGQCPICKRVYYAQFRTLRKPLQTSTQGE